MARRSLGTLTLDIVAQTAGFTKGMTAAERSSAKWRKKVERDVAKASKAVAAGAAVIAGSLAALTVTTVRNANEIAKLSSVAGSSQRDFQRYAAGARVVGVEQEKLADIFKDSADKVGDFLQTGGGPLADFFENIAPQIGVTAEQFRNLSGPQALQLYVSSLEKANLSQNEMTFFMEAIASDATLLLPLLKDNGAGFKLLGDEAERAGAVLSGDVLESTRELNAALVLLELSGEGLKNKVSSAVIPVMAQLATELNNVTVSEAAADAFADELAGALRAVAAAAVGSAAAISLTTQSAKTLFSITQAAGEGGAWYERIIPPLAFYRAFKNVDGVIDAAKSGVEGLDETAQRYGKFIDSILSAGGNTETGDTTLEKIAALQVFSRPRGSSGGGLSELSKDQAKLSDEIARTIEQLQFQARTLGMSEDQVKLLRLELKGATPAQIELAKAAFDTVSAYSAAQKAQEDYKALISGLRTEDEKLTDQLRDRLDVLRAIGKESDTDTRSRIIDGAFGSSPSVGGLDAAVGGPNSEIARLNDEQEQLNEWYNASLERLRSYRDDKLILESEYNAQELQLKQEHEEGIANIERARQQASMVAAESLFGDLADITRQFAGEQSDAYRVLFAIEKGAAIARSVVAIQTALAQASASAPFPANLGAIATVAAQTASIISTISSATIQGQAHDGLMSVPTTGTYLLEKGERVTTAETSKKLDRTLDNVKGGGMGNVRVVNAFDTSEVVGGYLGSSEGEKAILNVVRRNQRAIRSF
jgi:uncharacterized small protein (DUF1192 family)